MTRAGSLPFLLAGIVCLLSALPSCGPKAEEGRESLLREKDREFIRELTADMTQEVKLVLFTTGTDCEYCELTEEFLQDIASLSPRLTVEVLSLERNGERAEALGIDKAPGIAVLGKVDYGLRYYGLPTGYEFTTFAETLRKAADGDTGLQAETLEALAGLAHPVMITVFSTKS